MLESSETRARVAQGIEFGICVIVTLLAVWLHAVHVRHAGALWRDEASGVQLAALPSLGQVWKMLAHGAFPAFFPTLVRIWQAAGLGGSDFSLRVLGFLIGLGVLGAMWLSAKLLGCRWPSISLGLLAANPSILMWGDSLRAYGCGCVFILLTLGLIWRLMQAPGRASFLLAASSAILSVQTLYQNSVLVLAACIAGCVVCVRHRDYRSALLVLGVGLTAAASLLPYVPSIVGAQSWLLIDKVGFEIKRDFPVFCSTLGSPPSWVLWVWLGLVLIVFGTAWSALAQKVEAKCINPNDLSIFAALVVVVGTAGCYGFLHIAALVAQPWYFLPLVVSVAVAMDAALSTFGRLSRAVTAAVAFLVFFILFPSTLKLATCRLTNIDLVAAELQKRARADDLIVVSPCHFGITFERYYKGQTPWITLPDLADHRFHRLDLLKEKMRETSPVRDVLDRAARTLSSGKKLWFVGVLSPDVGPRTLPPAPIPDQPLGWWEGYYTDVWGRQLEEVITAHAEHIYRVPENENIQVHPYEKVWLLMVPGRHSE